MKLIERRMRMKTLLAAGAASALFALPSWSEERLNTLAALESPPALIGDAPQDATQVDAKTVALKKVGEARLKVLFWKIYDSSLYTATGTYAEGMRPLRLDIEYLRNVKSSALVERTGIEWDEMGRRHPRQQQWLAQLSNLWPNIEAKDVVSLELDQNNRATFLRNGEVLGSIEDEDFGPQFVDIWLSDDSTRPKLRRALIGQG